MEVDQDGLARAAAAIRSGIVPPELRPLVLSIMGDDAPRASVSPFERLALQLSDQVDRWMRARRLTQRTISCTRRSISRCLKAENVTIETVADVADALDCEVVLEFQPRTGGRNWRQNGQIRRQGLPSDPAPCESDSSPRAERGISQR